MPLQPSSSRAAPALQGRLRKFHAQGRGAFGLTLAWPDFATAARARLTARLERAGTVADDNALEEVADATFGHDLFLAIACERGVPGAWECLIASHADRLRALVSVRGARVDEAAEIVTDLPGHLVAVGDDGVPRIAHYFGTGSLFSWLATIVLRQLARRRREADSAEATRLGVVREPAVSSPTGDVLAAAAEQCQSFRAVMSEVLDAMPVRDRLALRYRFGDGLDLRQIAGLFAVGVPRACRVVAAAVERLRCGVRDRLAAEQWPSEERSVSDLSAELGVCLRSVHLEC